ncbi:uncharacterized protein LOC120633201 isoform X2 [Pararge aegeria]|nr:uncharacterized protein LOC120633201 isoform X2 [Pararge aegeria]
MFYADYKRFSGSMILVHDISEIPKKLFSLAEKMKENIDLFSQLDYMIRKIPINESKNVDLQLLIQNLLYCSGDTSGRIFCGGFMWCIRIDTESSLATLGCVAQALMSKVTHLTIECTVETAAICCLFTDLCHQVGLQEKVKLAILSETTDRHSNVTVDLNNIYVSEMKSGCVGIVTARSDVDSAVDTFLAATNRRPWNIKKILVQESVLERFKNTLEWKTKSTQNTPKRMVDQKLEALSASVYNYEGKIFLCEFAGTELEKNSVNTILIDSYRTTKELLSLLKGLNHFAASLWCSDIAESNEIAFNIDSSIIWINDFCNFNGPPKSSQAFYSLIDSHFTTALVTECPEIDEVMKLRRSWLQIAKSKREDIVRDILVKAPKRMIAKARIDAKDINFAFDNFAHVENDTVCFGTETTPVILKWDEEITVAITIFIAKGGGLLLIPQKTYYRDNDFTKYVFEELREKGAPVLGVDKYRSCRCEVPVLKKPIYKMKVVWSNFGTMFSN